MTGSSRLVGWLGLGLAGATALWALGFLPTDGTVFCPSRRMGLPCPNCGMTRALAALGRGDFEASWRFQPLAGVFVLEALGLWLFAGWTLRRKARWPRWSRRQIQSWGVAHLAALVMVWVGRTAAGTVPW